MYATSDPTHKAFGQHHVAGAMRQFADRECLTDVANEVGMKPQMLRNKLLPEQPHQLSIHEMVKITKASGNRALVDGILLELNCTPSVSLENYSADEHAPLTDRALEILTNSAAIGDIAKDIRVTNRVTERMRHAVMNRANRAMRELMIFTHEVEAKFQAVPVLTVASDAMQGMPIPGLM